MVSKITAMVSVLTLLMSATGLCSDSFDVRVPSLDNRGRFWVYKDGNVLSGKKEENIKQALPYGIPFGPYGWMPQNATEMLGLDMQHKQQPFDGEMCISVRVKTWKEPYWLGVGFISGPDHTMAEEPWWGKTSQGWYYDLSSLKKRKFVFHLRGEHGGERLQWKVGFLANEKYGDSLKFPRQTKWLALNKEWTRYELDLTEDDLSRVCSFCFVLSKAQQIVKTPIVFYIDSIWFE